MPPTTKVCAPALSIELNSASNDNSYYAGDTIIGSVVRNLPIVATNASLTLKLCGRAKVKLRKTDYDSVNNRHNTTYYRGRFVFFQANPDETTQILHNGPLHIQKDKPDSQNWAFAMKIPIHTGLDLDSCEKASFLSLNQNDVDRDQLPPSGHAHELDAYVEYYLEATLSFKRHGGVLEKSISTLPFPIRIPQESSPLMDWKLKSKESPYSISSYRLVPGADSASLSLKQRSKQFFSTSSVPRLDFKLQLSTPSVIQMNSQDCIPLLVRIIPVPGATSEILQGVPIKVTLNCITMNILTISGIIAASGERHGSGSYQDERGFRTDMELQRAFRLIDKPIILSTDAEQPVDIGQTLKLRLFPRGLYAGSKMLGDSPIQPSFTTYNIQRTHSIRYTIRVTIDQKTFEGLQDISTTILSPAISTVVSERPPPPFVTVSSPSLPVDNSYLPTFEEAVGSSGGEGSNSIIARDAKS